MDGRARALRHLCQERLGIAIQAGEHSPIEVLLHFRICCEFLK